MERRDFLKGTAWMGAAAVAAGCMSEKWTLGSGVGGNMHGFAVPPLKRIRVGVIGLGNRGSDAARRLTTVPGVDVVAICDIRPERIQLTQKLIAKNNKPAPREYTGEDGWKRLTDAADVDVVYNVTDWIHHAPMSIYALKAGKHAFMEVPAGVTEDECWELVETAETTQRHCMMLENCNYGDTETLLLNLCQHGGLGELVHAECAYIHDLRRHNFQTGKDGYANYWRLRFNSEHKGNNYPTHGLGPVCWYMDINRGDRLDYLVSLESQQANLRHYAEVVYADDKENPWKKDVPIEKGDMTTTLVKTVKGRSIMIQHDVFSPRPYCRINLVSGTKGTFWGMPWRNGSDDQWRFAMDGPKCSGVHKWIARHDPEGVEFEKKWSHPMWKTAGDIARLAGGHGGKDFMMDLRWAYCLQNGLPLDIDVYDSATWSVIRDLSERSVRSGSMPQKIPDFTRGGWKTAKPIGDMIIDLAKLELTPQQRELISRQKATF